MSVEGWLVFRGKLMSDPNVMSSMEFDPNDLPEVVEVVKGDMISKSYMKLKENPLFHPNVSYGDILKVKPCDDSLSENVTVLEFSGIESDFDVETEVQNFGGEETMFSTNFLSQRKNLDSKIKPIINDKFEQGLVYEPVNIISHGSYKINITFNANNEELNSMKEYFKKYNAHFQPSSAPNLGSVSFKSDFKFKKAVDCLESASWVNGCYLAFSPNDFPDIEFNPDLIPKS